MVISHHFPTTLIFSILILSQNILVFSITRLVELLLINNNFDLTIFQQPQFLSECLKNVSFPSTEPPIAIYQHLKSSTHIHLLAIFDGGTGGRLSGNAKAESLGFHALPPKNQMNLGGTKCSAHWTKMKVPAFPNNWWYKITERRKQ